MYKLIVEVLLLWRGRMDTLLCDRNWHPGPNRETGSAARLFKDASALTLTLSLSNRGYDALPIANRIMSPCPASIPAMTPAPASSLRGARNHGVLGLFDIQVRASTSGKRSLQIRDADGATSESRHAIKKRMCRMSTPSSKMR
jgi:hypothetical protein